MFPLTYERFELQDFIFYQYGLLASCRKADQKLGGKEK